MTNANLKGKDLFHLSACSQSLREVRAGTHETNLEAIVYTETIEGCTYWLTRFAALPVFLEYSGPTDQWRHCPEEACPSPINHQSRNVLQAFPQGILTKVFSLMRFPFL